MKLRKLLSATLSAALIIATMSIPAFADKADAPVVDVAEEATTVPSEEPTPEATPTPTTEVSSTADIDDGTIDSKEDLVLLRDTVNKGETLAATSFTLTADIDLGGEEWTPIAGGETGITFGGSFNGENHTISNYQITGTNSLGLFGAFSGSISDLNVSNVTINGKESLGGITGSLIHGNITNCDASNVTITGNHWAGGIVGYTYTNFSDCNVKNIKITLEFAGTPVLDPLGDKAGGLAGFFGEGTHTITNCTATNVQLESIRDVGGLIGAAALSSSKLTVTNCHIYNEEGFDGYIRAIGQGLGQLSTRHPAAGGIIGFAQFIPEFYGCSSAITPESTNDNYSGLMCGDAAGSKINDSQPMPTENPEEGEY